MICNLAGLPTETVSISDAWVKNYLFDSAQKFIHREVLGFLEGPKFVEL